MTCGCRSRMFPVSPKGSQIRSLRDMPPSGAAGSNGRPTAVIPGSSRLARVRADLRGEHLPELHRRRARVRLHRAGPGGTSALFATTDGGTTWAPVSNLAGTAGARIVFTTDLDGWMVNATVVVDGGGEEGPLFQYDGRRCHLAPGPRTAGRTRFRCQRSLARTEWFSVAPPGDAPNPLGVFTTDNGGPSWTSHPTPNDPATGRSASPGVGIPFSPSTYTDWSLFVGPDCTQRRIRRNLGKGRTKTDVAAR